MGSQTSVAVLAAALCAHACTEPQARSIQRPNTVTRERPTALLDDSRSQAAREPARTLQGTSASPCTGSRCNDPAKESTEADRPGPTQPVADRTSHEPACEGALCEQAETLDDVEVLPKFSKAPTCAALGEVKRARILVERTGIWLSDFDFDSYRHDIHVAILRVTRPTRFHPCLFEFYSERSERTGRVKETWLKKGTLIEVTPIQRANRFIFRGGRVVQASASAGDDPDQSVTPCTKARCADPTKSSTETARPEPALPVADEIPAEPACHGAQCAQAGTLADVLVRPASRDPTCDAVARLKKARVVVEGTETREMVEFDWVYYIHIAQLRVVRPSKYRACRFRLETGRAEEPWFQKGALIEVSPDPKGGLVALRAGRAVQEPVRVGDDPDASKSVDP